MNRLQLILRYQVPIAARLPDLSPSSTELGHGTLWSPSLRTRAVDLRTRLPAIDQSREFYSFDSSPDSEAQKQSVQMRFHGSESHLELAGDFGVVTTLQK